MPQIKYIFRDFWWVVANLYNDKVAYFPMMADAYNIPKAEVIAISSVDICAFRRWEISETQLWKNISRKIGVPRPAKTKKIFHQQLEYYARLYKSIISFVVRLQKLAYICIILSDDNKTQSTKLKKAWRYNQFDDVLISCDIGIAKYDDRIAGTNEFFSFILKKYKIKANEAIFIDDRIENCEVAKRMKIKTILAQNPRQTIRDIKKILSIK